MMTNEQCIYEIELMINNMDCAYYDTSYSKQKLEAYEVSIPVLKEIFTPQLVTKLINSEKWLTIIQAKNPTTHNKFISKYNTLRLINLNRLGWELRDKIISRSRTNTLEYFYDAEYENDY